MARLATARRDTLTVLASDGLLSAAAAPEQSSELTANIEGLEREIDTAMACSPLAPLIHARDVRAAVDGLDVLPLREVVRSLMTVIIEPAATGVRFDASQVRAAWR